MTNEMTAEEAIRWLDAIKKYYIHGGDEAYDKKRMKAIDMAIKALEQQPSEDCISREAVIRLVEQYPNIIGNRCSGLISDIKHLPSVTPKYTDEEIDKAQAVEQAYVDKMVELAVEETKRPKGKWIFKNDNIAIPTGYYQCSECEEGKLLVKDNYCPNCGSYNAENKENEE